MAWKADAASQGPLLKAAGVGIHPQLFFTLSQHKTGLCGVGSNVALAYKPNGSIPPFLQYQYVPLLSGSIKTSHILHLD